MRVCTLLKKNDTRAWKHIRRTRCQGQRRNVWFETSGPTPTKTKEVYVRLIFRSDLINASCVGGFRITGEGSAGNAGVAAVGIPRAPFCQQMRKKLFTKTVTRLPSGIALLTCEWRALQQLAHQNPLDLTRVAITWHIKSIPAPILTPPHPPFLSLQSWQTFYAYSHVQMCRS